MLQAFRSQEGSGEAWCRGGPGKGSGKGWQDPEPPLPFYLSVKLVIKRHVIKDMTALGAFVNLFSNARAFHFNHRGYQRELLTNANLRFPGPIK